MSAPVAPVEVVPIHGECPFLLAVLPPARPDDIARKVLQLLREGAHLPLEGFDPWLDALGADAKLLTTKRDQVPGPRALVTPMAEEAVAPEDPGHRFGIQRFRHRPSGKSPLGSAAAVLGP